MTNLIVALIFLTLALLGIVIRKTYYHLPVKELKRRAKKHDSDAVILYSAVAYERSLRALLWLFIGTTSAVSIVLLARINFWLGILLIAPLLWLAFSYIPATKVGPFENRLTITLTPFILWLLNYLHPTLSKNTEKIEKRFKQQRHTKLFERDDLIDLIEKQKHQTDSRFTAEELEIAKRSLEFGEHTVGDVLTPAEETKSVLEMDHVGPVLIDEIYKTGQKYALVRDKKDGPLVGVLEAGQLGIHSQGLVANLMRPTIYYLHEDDNLSEALKAFFITNFPVFVVVNSHEEFVGIVTIENVLKQLVGHIPGDDFSEYASLNVVANKYNENHHASEANNTTETD